MSDRIRREIGEKKKVLSKVMAYKAERDRFSITHRSWFTYANGPDGSAASVFLYFSPAELETLGTGIFNAFEEERSRWQPV